MPSMTAWITSAALLLGISAAAAQETVVVGAVVSQTGAHARLATEYRNGLLLWQEEVNGAGGLLGRKVELRLKDDGSEAPRTGRAYAELVDEGAHVFIGPYGSAATLTASSEAERARRGLLKAAGAAGPGDKSPPPHAGATPAGGLALAHGAPPGPPEGGAPAAKNPR